MRYYAVVDFLLPPAEGGCSEGAFGLEPRRWGVGISSWAYIQTTPPHRLFFPYTLGDLLSRRVNFELSVEAEGFEDAAEKLDGLYFGLLTHGVLPFAMHYLATHSLNLLSEIAAPPDDERRVLSEALRSQTEAYEAHLFHPDLRIYETGGGAEPAVSASIFKSAVKFAAAWTSVESATPSAKALRQAICAAPAIEPSTMRVMMLWSALESLFPDIHAELTHRIGLSLAQLCATSRTTKTDVTRIRRLYADRSNVAHGSRLKKDPWPDAWQLAIEVADAIARRGRVPTEDELLAELLA